MKQSPSEALPRKERIAKRRDFLRAYEQGVRQFGRFSVVFVAPNDLGHSRVGVTATKKLGKAIVRNRTKRWVREIYRRNRAPLGLDRHSLDFVVNVKGSAAVAPFQEFSSDLVRTLRRALAAAQKPA
ncbi:MAG TPA: ribonuclease P protein component [Thermoanaerobaculia bacterium]